MSPNERFFKEGEMIKWMSEEEIENLNRQITGTEIKNVIKNFPKNKSPGPDVYRSEFYQTFREELTPILLNLFQKIAAEEHSKLIL